MSFVELVILVAAVVGGGGLGYCLLITRNDLLKCLFVDCATSSRGIEVEFGRKLIF